MTAEGEDEARRQRIDAAVARCEVPHLSGEPYPTGSENQYQSRVYGRRVPKTYSRHCSYLYDPIK